MRARIRTIKPDIFHDEELWALAERTELPILQGFAGLWCYADREGRFEYRPAALKALILPYWGGSMFELLAELQKAGLIRRYEVDGRQYGLVVNFKKHQAVNAREPASVLPPPPVDDTARARTCTHVGNGNGNGKGREGSGNDARGATLPPVLVELAEAEARLRDDVVGVAPVHTASNHQGQSIPATYHTLDGWEMSDEVRSAAIMAGVPDIDERVATARTLRIAAPHGTTDRDRWVRAQFPKWKRWREEDQAKKSFARAPGEPPPKPKPPRVKGCPEWVRELHETMCRAEGHDVRREAMAWARSHHINPKTLDRNIASQAFTDHLTKLFQKGAA